MSVKARCLNYTGCLLAYRGEVIEIAQNAPMVCPECGKTVSVTTSKAAGAGKIIGLVVGLLVLIAAIYFLKPLFSKVIAPKPTETTEETVPSSTPRTVVSDTPSKTTTTPEPATVSNTPPPPPPTSPAKIELGLDRAENMKVRDEVLKRIDLMPKITQANKDKLYNSVQRAKKMGLIMTIPFSSGSARIPANEIPSLRAKIEDPEILKFREDPTYVFVILGYADAQGDNNKNIAISQTRADSVLEAMRDKCGVNNVMHSVAMGSSTLMDANSLEKNRVVEVWAVLP